MNTSLILKCKRLDRLSQREMVNSLSSILFPICRRYTNSFEEAKDLLQGSLILIFNKMDKCKSTEIIPFKSWCKRIAINSALGHIRKQSSQLAIVNDSIYSMSTIPNIYSKLDIEDTLILLQSIPIMDRTVFNLAVMDGYSHKEIAVFLNIKESSSRTFLVRARQSMQKLVESQENHVAFKNDSSTGI